MLISRGSTRLEEDDRSTDIEELAGTAGQQSQSVLKVVLSGAVCYDGWPGVAMMTGMDGCAKAKKRG